MAGTSTLKYEVVEGWEQLPAGYVHRDVAGVAVDGEDRVYLICRGDHPIIAYDRNGKFLGSWGEGQFTYRTHGKPQTQPTINLMYRILIRNHYEIL